MTQFSLKDLCKIAGITICLIAAVALEKWKAWTGSVRTAWDD